MGNTFLRANWENLIMANYSTSTNSPIEARGFYSTFFASAANAGIIKADRQGNRVIMRKGPNFKKFVDGAKIVYV